MGRPHIEFIQSLDVSPAPVGNGPFAGARRRLLSEDDETGASTAIVTLDAGWSSDLSGYDRPIELFLLAGDCQLADHELGPGCYAYVPAGSSQAGLSAATGAHAIIMLEPTASAGDEPILVRDTNEMRWAASAFSTVPAGLVNKRLRDDPVNGDRTWIAACPPGWVEERAEVHPTVEESVTLRGEILLGTSGVMTPGCYFWRPPMVPHGPMYSRTGAEFFFRTKGGALEVDYQTVPEWDRLVREYRAREPLYPVIREAD